MKKDDLPRSILTTPALIKQDSVKWYGELQQSQSIIEVNEAMLKRNAKEIARLTYEHSQLFTMLKELANDCIGKKVKLKPPTPAMLVKAQHVIEKYSK